jgi:hypothetical protein
LLKPVLIGVLLLIGATSCERATPDFGKSVAYTFNSNFMLQRSMGLPVVDSCFHAAKPTGTLKFKINDASVTLVDADGMLDVTEEADASTTVFDNIPMFYQSGPLRSAPTGSRDDVTFSVTTSGVAAGAAYSRRFTYTGSLKEDGGVGILRYELSGTSNFGSTTTNNIIRVGVALKPFVSQKIDPAAKG